MHDGTYGERLGTRAQTSARLRLGGGAPDREAVVVDNDVTTSAQLDRAELAAALMRDFGPGDHRVGRHAS